MNVTVNGEPADIDSRLTVAELIERYGLAKQAVAVEVNEELIPKREHAKRRLAENDRIELVTLVGGG